MDIRHANSTDLNALNALEQQLLTGIESLLAK